MMMFVLIIPVQVFCSYPTEQEAEMLFSSNVLKKGDRINNSQYETFFNANETPCDNGDPKNSRVKSIKWDYVD